MVFARDLPHSYAEALRLSRQILGANHEIVRNGTIDTEAEQIVIGAHRIATGEKLSRAEFFSRQQDRLPETSAERVLVLAGQRAQGIPLQHLLGWQEFLEHEYEVNASTLIPRPETEVLVAEALRELRDPGLGIEIGLGTGVISIELLSRFPKLKIVASELSPSAIELAQRNATRVLGSSERLSTVLPKTASEVLEPFHVSGADFLISNPPYLDIRSTVETETEVRAYEPKTALFPESGDPLHFYRRIALGAAKLLKPGGMLFLEIAAERARETEALFRAGWKTHIVADLAGRPRVLIAETS